MWLQDDELEQALAEAVTSLAEIQQLRLADANSVELLQLETELQEAVQSLKASLEPKQKAARRSSPGGVSAGPGQEGPTFPTQEQPDAFFDRPTKKQKLLPRQPGMHPRNQYATEEPDFAALAREYPELQPFLKAEKSGRASLAFDNPDANR